MKQMEKQLAQAIIEQLGYDEMNDEARDVLKDVCRGGANAGFGGFIYSSEILEWYKKNRERVIEHLKDLANDLGVGFLEMIKGFFCLKGYELSIDEIGEIVFGQNYDHEMTSSVIDALAWACLEDLAFQYDN